MLLNAAVSADAVLLATLLVSSMLAVGTMLDPAALRGIRDRPGPLLAGLAVNIGLVPAVALIAVATLDLTAASGLGLFLAAVAAGGGSGALLAHHVRGDLASAAGLQGLLVFTSVAVVPAWLGLAGDRFPGEDSLAAPGPVLAAVAALQLTPLVGGMALRWWWPRWAAGVQIVARRTADLLLLTATTWFAATNLHLLRATDALTVGAMSLVIATSMVGLAVPSDHRGRQRGLAMIGLVRNLSLALAMTTLASQPEATAAAVLTYGVLMYLGVGGLLLSARCCAASPSPGPALRPRWIPAAPWSRSGRVPRAGRRRPSAGRPPCSPLL